MYHILLREVYTCIIYSYYEIYKAIFRHKINRIWKIFKWMNKYMNLIQIN